MSPNFTYPLWLVWMGRQEEVQKFIKDGAKLADPKSKMQALTLGYRYYYARQLETSLELARSCGDPWLQQLCLQPLGKEEEALALVLERVAGYEPPDRQEEYQAALIEDGPRGLWQKWAEQLVAQNSKPYDIAGLFAWAGDKDRAFECLERACELPLSLPFIADARFDSLRNDLRYVEILRQLRLPEEALAIHVEPRE